MSNDTNGEPAALKVAGIDATEDGAPSGQRQCPNCDQFGDSGEKTCWLCGYDFQIGTQPVSANAPAADAVLGQAPSMVTLLTPPDQFESEAVATPGSSALPAAAAGADAGKIASAPAIGEPETAGRIVARVVGDGQPAGTMLRTQVTALGGELDESMFDVDLTARAAAPTAPAPVATARPGTGKRQRMPKEPSAISIPDAVLSLSHLAVPHIVLVVDFEQRRSREGKQLSPPAPRAPVMISLEDGMMFGRNISGCNLDFDPAASTPHGCFVLNEEGRYEIVDMKSTNGTKLNGDYLEPGQPTPIKDGAVITLGLWTKIIFYLGDTATTATARKAP